MLIDKKDLATIAALSTVFFLLASWNLGMTSVPLTSWTPSEGESIYIDFDAYEKVSAACFLLKNGEVTLRVYTGHPESWSGGMSCRLSGYYSWQKIDIHDETRFLKFTFSSCYGEIAEIAALNDKGERIAIKKVESQKGYDEKLLHLIDEQEKVECPSTYLSQTYFDEIYYVRAAEDYLNFRIPYEWTHPPLGKLIIAVSILTFGYNPFGWRIMGVVFATLMVPVIYCLGKRMFGTWISGFASAFLLTLDFMHFTMGRIATVDTYVVFFSLASNFFFFTYFQNVLKSGWKTSTRPLFWAVVLFALSFSAKWYALYGFVGEVLLLLPLRFKDISALKEGLTSKVKAFFSHPFFSITDFLVYALIIYMLTFVPHMLMGYTLTDVFELQFAMYTYHSTLTATHPFSSPWWSWPFIVRPVWFYVSYLPLNMVSTIAALGNPAVWWIGFALVLCAVEETVKGKNYTLGFIEVVFFFQWLPYIIISRCVFLYHFYINVAFLILATAYFLDKFWSRKAGKIACLIFLVLAAALFIVFYPVISGFPVPIWWRDSLKWFSGWIF